MRLGREDGGVHLGGCGLPVGRVQKGRDEGRRAIACALPFTGLTLTLTLTGAGVFCRARPSGRGLRSGGLERGEVHIVREQRHCLLELVQELWVLLASRRQLVLGEEEGLVNLLLPNQLNEPLLLQMEVERRVLVENL